MAILVVCMNARRWSILGCRCFFGFEKVLEGLPDLAVCHARVAGLIDSLLKHCDCDSTHTLLMRFLFVTHLS